MAGNLAQPIATDKADAWTAFVSATLNTVVWTVRKVSTKYYLSISLFLYRIRIVHELWIMGQYEVCEFGLDFILFF